jgi:capsular exopolysaccharide synthesis family protein
MAVGLVHYFVSPSSYRAATTIQVGKRSPLNFSSDPNPWLDAWASVKYYPTQYRLLKSRGLAELVVRNLRLDEPSAIDSDGNETLAGSDKEMPLVAAQKTTARLAGQLLSGLNINPISETELVEISYVSTNPEEAARIANGFADAYIDWGIQERSQTVDKASVFLTDQIESLRLEIDEKEAQLEDYSRTQDIINLDPSTNVSLQRLEQLNAEYTRALRDRFEKQAYYNELEDSPAEAVADVPAVSELQRTLVRLEQEYASKLEIYKPDWPEMLDLSSDIEQTRDRLRSTVEEEAQGLTRSAYTDYQTALREERALDSQIRKVRQEAMNLNSAAVEYRDLQMEITNKRTLLDDLSKRRAETGVSASLQGTRESNVRIIDRALVPGAPFRPSLQNDLAMGLTSGLALGIGLVLLLHLLDRTIKSPEELERLLGYPVLAVIPDISAAGKNYGGYASYGSESRSKTSAAASILEGKGREQTDERSADIELLPEFRPRLAVSEAYRSLRTALLLSSARQLEVVTVTSAEAGEGKTATATNLASVMAQLGRRVLLVDADLRKPRLHKVFKVSNRRGLVNVLASGEPPDSVLLTETPVKGLSLCPSGPQPPNPSELLASERMHEFLEFARANFDFVIVDSPPVLAVTDAVLPGSIGDGVVLCLRAHKVLREDVRSCRNILERAEVRILGAVLNRYQPARAGSYGRKYYHYESYSEPVEDSASDSAA